MHEGNRFSAPPSISGEGEKRTGSQVDESFRKGIELEEREPAAALQVFDIILRDRPDHVGSHFHRGLCLVNLGRLEEAITAFRFAGSLEPKHGGSKLKLGLCLLAQANFGQAREFLVQATVLSPGDPEAWTALALANLEPGLEKASQAAAEKALELKPEAAAAAKVRDRAKALLATVVEKAMEDYVSTEMISGRERMVDKQVSLVESNRGGQRVQGTLTQWQYEAEAASATPTLPRRLPRTVRALPGVPTDTFEATIIDAEYLLRAGSLSKALQKYESAIALNGQDPAGWIGKGYTMFLQGRFEDATGAGDRALSLSPESTMAMVLKASVCYMTSKFDDGLVLLDHVLELDPENSDAHNTRGALLVGQFRITEVIEACEKAIDIDPGHGNAMLQRAGAHRALNEVKEDRKWSQLGDTRMAEFETTRRLIALALGNSEKAHGKSDAGDSLVPSEDSPERTLESCDRAIVAGGMDPRLFAAKAGALQRLERPGDALACLDSALVKWPAEPALWLGKGGLYLQAAAFALATPCIFRALILRPGDASAWQGLASVHSSLGRALESLQCLDIALSIDPEDAAAWVGRAGALLGIGEHQMALLNLEKAMEKEPGSVAALSVKGGALWGLGRDKEAVECFDAAIALDEKRVAAWLGKGAVMLRHGMAAEALAAFEKIVDAEPTMDPGVEGKAGALAVLGRLDEARVLLREASIPPEIWPAVLDPYRGGLPLRLWKALRRRLGTEWVRERKN